MANFDVKPFKVAYYKSGQPEILYSSFFDKFEDAISFAKGLTGPYLVFRKHLQDSTEFSWELMPYGSYRDYKTAIQVVSYKWLILGLIITIAYIAFKMKNPNGQ